MFLEHTGCWGTGVYWGWVGDGCGGVKWGWVVCGVVGWDVMGWGVVGWGELGWVGLGWAGCRSHGFSLHVRGGSSPDEYVIDPSDI